MMQSPLTVVGTRRGPRFERRTAVVPGAAAGIGRATADRLATEGAHVVVTDVDGEDGEGTVELIEERGGSAEFRGLDVSDAEKVEAVVGDVVADRGLDVLVNDAGIGHEAASVEETGPDVLDRVIGVNCKASGTAAGWGHGLVLDGGYSIS